MAYGTVRDVDRGWKRISALAREPKRVVVISVPATDPKHHQPYPLFVEYGHRVVTKGDKDRRLSPGGMGPFQGEANTRFEGPTKGYVEPRPFMAWTWEAHDAYREEVKELARFLWVRAGQDEEFGGLATTKLRELGEKVVVHVKDTIQAMGLIDTGTMYRSVRCNVRVERAGMTESADHSNVERNW